MRSATGRWVSGNDFFDRDRELQVLETLVRDRNHVLLAGQRRMGKTSVLRELGRRLERRGWVFLFVDVEGSKCSEDAIANVAEAIHPFRSMTSRFASEMRRWLSDNFEEINALEFGLKIRAGLDPGNWQRHGDRLLRICADQEQPVLLVIDELPIFLMRILRHDAGLQRVDEFLSWLRAAIQSTGNGSMVLIVSGSIGLEPLVQRLGIPDRINHLHPFRIGPWDRDTSIQCLDLLAQSYGLAVEDGVARAVHERLGIGVPHHVQSFFARLREFAAMQGRDRVTVGDVDDVYRTKLLGPSGQSDLSHYETRLKEGLGDEVSYSIAMEILAEAATQEVFTRDSRRILERLYSPLVDDSSAHVGSVLEVLAHDGYLESGDDGYRFQFRLLRDWWSVRFRDNYTRLRDRLTDFGPEGQA